MYKVFGSMIVSLWKLGNSTRSNLPQINAGVIGLWVAQEQIPAAKFVHKYKHVFAFKLVVHHNHLN